MMLEPTSPLTLFRDRRAHGTTPADVAAESARHANGNAGRNTYIGFSEEQLRARAQALTVAFADASHRPSLYGVPISLKDCFDMAGAVTTCGSRFYAGHHAPAAHDSAMAARLYASGALITGKTHLHSLAYGITGQNRDFGDCLQPRNPTLLTGGSSSGAAASVQEGSALAAIGTDTGGSIRVPAALCGLTGYRASHRLAYAAGPWPAGPEGLWTGAAHLAQSFDTVGILMRDPRDAAPIASALFGVARAAAPNAPRVGYAATAFLTECDPDVLAAYAGWQEKLALAGASLGEIDTTGWAGSQEIFAGVQAHEAAALHRGHYDEFEPAIAQRLHWGASLTPQDVAGLEQRMLELRARIAALFDQFDFLMLPCAPVSRLHVSADQTAARAKILRLTTPFSIAGAPVAALPGEIIGAPVGAGVQIAAPPGGDAALLAFAGALGDMLAAEKP